MRVEPLDIRIVAIGDSFVFGARDPQRLGWLGRLPFPNAAAYDLTLYNLGVRGDTSSDIARRWEAESRLRLKDGDRYGVIFSFGVNDTMELDGRVRVDHETGLQNFREIVAGAGAHQLAILVVGPPPVADAEHNKRVQALDQAMNKAAQAAGVPFVSVFDRLLNEPVWMTQVNHADGAHPSGEGYALFADLLAEAWLNWLNHELGASKPQ